MKLTKAQLRELQYLADVATVREHYADNYPPIVALRKLGLVDHVPGKFGGNLYAITEAGRLALSQNQEQSE